MIPNFSAIILMSLIAATHCENNTKTYDYILFPTGCLQVFFKDFNFFDGKCIA